MHQYISDYLSKSFSERSLQAVRETEESLNMFHLFHAGRSRQAGVPGPPGPPGPPGIPGTFSGSMEDISARIIAYIQRKPVLCSELLLLYYNYSRMGAIINCVVQLQVQAQASALVLRVLQDHLVLLDLALDP